MKMGKNKNYQKPQMVVEELQQENVKNKILQTSKNDFKEQFKRKFKMKVKQEKELYTAPEVSCIAVESSSLLAGSLNPKEQEEEEGLTGDDNSGILGV